MIRLWCRAQALAWRGGAGQTTTEYAVIIGLAAVAMVFALKLLLLALDAAFTDAAGGMVDVPPEPTYLPPTTPPAP